jgi:hypothetical protein
MAGTGLPSLTNSRGTATAAPWADGPARTAPPRAAGAAISSPVSSSTTTINCSSVEVSSSPDPSNPPSVASTLSTSGLPLATSSPLVMKPPPVEEPVADPPLTPPEEPVPAGPPVVEPEPLSVPLAPVAAAAVDPPDDPVPPDDSVLPEDPVLPDDPVLPVPPDDPVLPVLVDAGVVVAELAGGLVGGGGALAGMKFPVIVGLLQLLMAGGVGAPGIRVITSNPICTRVPRKRRIAELLGLLLARTQEVQDEVAERLALTRR